MEYHNNIATIFKGMHKANESLVRAVCDELGHSDKADELVLKLLDTSFNSVKPKKDPNRTKRPRSAYLYFCAENRAKVQKENPTMRMGEVSRVLGEQWKAISIEDRSRFEDMHQADKARYTNER